MKLSFWLKNFYLQVLIIILSGCGCPQIYAPDKEPPPLPAIRIPEKIRVALVLGSGGVRGMAHVGVLEELENAGIDFDIIIGCSAGSIVGALYADHPSAQCIKKAVYELKTDTVIDIDIGDCRYGMSQGTSMRKVLDKYLDAECFEELKIPLIVVASDLRTGELVPMGSGELVQAVQASCSIPFVFVPQEMYGRVMVDGGVVNPVPACIAKDLGADIVIAVDLCELLPKTFPTNLFEIATRSSEIMFMWQNQNCTRCADVIIQPKMRDIGTFNDSKKWQIYEAGKKAAREAIPKIIALLEERNETCEHKVMKYVNIAPYKP